MGIEDVSILDRWPLHLIRFVGLNEFHLSFARSEADLLLTREEDRPSLRRI